ncbi:MAG: hypothetical protein Q4D73_04340 [Actinomycetaceae bacterium]|nr:hypothetical protein [Actinomycetaceae bacterium]
MESVWHDEELEALRYKVLFNKARPVASTLGLVLSLYARVSGTLAVGGVLLFLPWILWFFPPIF